VSSKQKLYANQPTKNPYKSKKINASRQKWILPPKNPWVGSFYRTQPWLFATLNGEGC